MGDTSGYRLNYSRLDRVRWRPKKQEKKRKMKGGGKKRPSHTKSFGRNVLRGEGNSPRKEGVGHKDGGETAVASLFSEGQGPK